MDKVGDLVFSFSDLSPIDVDRFIILCRKALAAHFQEAASSPFPAARADAEAAIETTLGNLLELLEVAPEAKKSKIRALIQRYTRLQ